MYATIASKVYDRTGRLRAAAGVHAGAGHLATAESDSVRAALDRHHQGGGGGLQPESGIPAPAVSSAPAASAAPKPAAKAPAAH